MYLGRCPALSLIFHHFSGDSGTAITREIL